MPRVLCTRPGASTLICGVAFAPTAEGMLSEQISLEQARSLFLDCAGYRLAPDPEPEKRGPGRPRKEDTL
jgi:hypothetical protein